MLDLLETEVILPELGGGHPGRPVVLVENYQPVSGYVWINGGWSWDGREWIWTGGHYEADAQIRVYYDDGSWD